MLIIEGHVTNQVIPWSSIERVVFDEKSESPDKVLTFHLLSGKKAAATNPTDLMGEDVDFEITIKAMIDNYTCWRIKSNHSMSVSDS